MRMIDGDALREQLVWCKEQAGRFDTFWDDVIERLDSIPTVSGWLTTWDDKCGKYVTHWMPLPEPPKEEKDDAND